MYVSAVIAGSSSAVLCWEKLYWLGEKAAFCCCSFCSPSLYTCLPSQVAQTVKNLPAVRETWVWSLGWEDPLVEGMATHSSVLAWRTHGQRSLAGTVHGVAESWTRLRFFSHTYTPLNVDKRTGEQLWVRIWVTWDFKLRRSLWS